MDLTSFIYIIFKKVDIQRVLMTLDGEWSIPPLSLEPTL